MLIDNAISYQNAMSATQSKKGSEHFKNYIRKIETQIKSCYYIPQKEPVTTVWDKMRERTNGI